MYQMTAEEIRQRFLLLQQIDSILPFVVIGFSIPWLILSIIRYRYNPIGTPSFGSLARDVEWKLWGWWIVLFNLVEIVGYLFVVAIFGYFIWRSFFAFY